jgi:FkbH-like protein
MAAPDAHVANREALRALKMIAASDDPWAVLAPLARCIEQGDLDYTQAKAFHRVLRTAGTRANELGQAPPGPSFRLAVLAGMTSSQLVWMLELLLSISGLFPDIYESPFGVWRQEILDPRSELYRFAPSIVILAPGPDAVRLPPFGSDEATVHAALESEVDAWRGLWERLGTAGIQVVQDNFVLPAQRPLGSREATIPAAPTRYLARLNAALQDAAPGHVKIHDLEHAASWFGKRAWFDERFILISKQSCALEALPTYASSLAGLVRAIRGRAKKCLVLDLDNTLWGGVVGDDGVEGLDLGQGSPEGEAFLRFQRYVHSLRERGVVLAVCSKNDEANARAPFLHHPEILLKLDDVACFVANWTDKPTNLRSIAQRLQLGLDSLVFVDDNPAERAFVRAELPQVAVPELPPDPAGFGAAIDRHRYFELATFTDEDRRRADQYLEGSRREDAVAASAADLDGFLRGLDMVATIRGLGVPDLARAAQLANKSNQYNLTTWRVTEAEMRALAVDAKRVVRTVRLRDRFGDSGLISVAIAREQEDALHLEMWLMSCRVLARGVEHALLNHLWSAALARGLKRLCGVYLPTEKNGLARDHYERLGFAPVAPESSDPPGATRWELVISGTELPEHPYVREEN